MDNRLVSPIWTPQSDGPNRPLGIASGELVAKDTEQFVGLNIKAAVPTLYLKLIQQVIRAGQRKMCLSISWNILI